MTGVAMTIQREDLAEILSLVESVGGAMASDEAKMIAGTSLRETLQAHFYALENDSLHHRSAQSLGADMTHFYGEAAQETQTPQVEAEGVSVSITKQGVAQRYFGGEIEGDPFLTIPARAEAYGHRARDFDNLRLIIFPSGAGALVEREATVLRGGKRGASNLAGSLGGKSKGDEIGGGVFYWLVRHVHQEPDETVLPTEDEMIDPVIDRLQERLDETWNGGAR